MRHFASYKELRAAIDNDTFRFLPEFGPASFRCADCGHAELNTSGASAGTGYAVYDDAEMVCYSCADNRQRKEMLDSAGPFYCYLSGDAKTVTTWTGGKLGNVSSYGESRSGWHGAYIARFHVRDVHGNWWTGRGAGKGMTCTLRRMKHAPR